MDTRGRIAWNLRKIRADKKVTQENLAVDAGVDRTTISGIERGDYNISVDLLDRIAAALAIDIAVLFAVPSSGEIPPAALPAGRKPGK
ncbi:helix-turn-helix transcriptional regulator [Rhizobium ruizarguesonis]|nr:helix-turn-helix transcriptional regulator [Rhizobium ruizarguesonis]